MPRPFAKNSTPIKAFRWESNLYDTTNLVRRCTNGVRKIIAERVSYVLVVDGIIKNFVHIIFWKLLGKPIRSWCLVSEIVHTRWQWWS